MEQVIYGNAATVFSEEAERIISRAQIDQRIGRKCHVHTFNEHCQLVIARAQIYDQATKIKVASQIREKETKGSGLIDSGGATR